MFLVASLERDTPLTVAVFIREHVPVGRVATRRGGFGTPHDSTYGRASTIRWFETPVAGYKLHVEACPCGQWRPGGVNPQLLKPAAIRLRWRRSNRAWAVAVQGGAAGEPVATHVLKSVIPATTTANEVRGLRSAIPLGAGNVEISMTLARKRVTGPPVAFTTRLRNESVPNVELLGGSLVKSRTRFGGMDELMLASSNSEPSVLLR